ncbi:MAG: NADH-quinone oxidoreductase subunit 15 [Deinococcales bacterium]
MKTSTLSNQDMSFYKAWANMLDWMQEYAEKHDKAVFEKQADFPDYIYRMERPYDLPTITMSASLSNQEGKPVLMLNASPRHSLFKEVTVHPFESHSYRKLSYHPEKKALSEGKRVFSKAMLFELADELFGHVHA